MTFVDVVTYLGLVAGGIISLGVIWNKVVKPFFLMLKKIDNMYERVEALPEWCATVDESLKQLHPNGGKSLKDRVNQTHLMMVEHLENHDRNNSGVS